MHGRSTAVDVKVVIVAAQHAILCHVKSLQMIVGGDTVPVGQLQSASASAASFARQQLIEEKAGTAPSSSTFAYAWYG